MNKEKQENRCLLVEDKSQDNNNAHKVHRKM